MIDRRLPAAALVTLGVASALACGPMMQTARPIPARVPIPGPFDAASPMVSSGTIAAEGNESGGKIVTAKEEMKNVPAMGDVPVERFMAAMLALKGAIGADCKECHPGEKYDSDEMRAKLKARQMIRMSTEINVQFFEKQARVTCYTCHRGKWAPEQEALESRIRVPSFPVPEISDEEGLLPAEQIYKRVDAFRGKPAGTMMASMNIWTAELGVECTFCHSKEGRWEAEGNINKDVTRAMVGMMDRINGTWFGGEPVVTCWGCHRGKAIPERVAPDPEAGTAPETTLP